jgi:hypothetical protein
LNGLMMAMTIFIWFLSPQDPGARPTGRHRAFQWG